MTRSLFLALVLAASGCASAPAPRPDAVASEADAPVELRGVWLTNVDSDVLLSRAAIAEAMQFLADHHFNVVYPVVLNGGLTVYPSATMEAVTGIAIDPRYAGRDPLAEVVEEAGRHGIAVIPWFEFGFAASHRADGGPILAARPAWAARDRDGTLLAKNGFEWMNAFDPEVQQFVLDLVLEVARTYDVAGVQGDDRLPALPSTGGYSETTRALYRAEHGADPPRAYLDRDWLQWRADRLGDFAARLYREVKAVDPALQVSWSPSPYPWGYRHYLQDWPDWLARGVADQVHPQVYRYGLDAYTRTLADQQAVARSVGPEADARLYPGVLMNVGDYVISADDLLGAVAANRAAGYRGEVFFFYEGLRKDGGALADTLRATFYARPARLPFSIRQVPPR